RTKAKIKIATLNIRGGGSATTRPKWDHVNQLLRTQQIGILAIQESHLKEEDVITLHEKFPTRLHVLNNSDPEQTAAKGVAIVINKTLLPWREAKMRVLIPGRASLLKIPWHNGEVLSVLAVYAPNDPEENASFWTTLRVKLEEGRLGKPDVMLGDMNVVEEASDRLPARRDAPLPVTSLGNLKDFLRLTDGWRATNGHDLSYSYTQSYTQSRSRIDRIYVTPTILENSQNWEINLTAIKTDHKLVSMEFSHPRSPHLGKGRWAIPLHCLKNRKLMQSFRDMGLQLDREMAAIPIEESWKTGRSVQRLLCEYKAKVVKAAKEYARTAAPILEYQIEKVKKSLRAAMNETNLTEEERKLNICALEEEQTRLELLRHTKVRSQVAARHWLEAETVGKYWVGMN
ncbi:DNase I-like protein, partial [Agrocybe pediades]